MSEINWSSLLEYQDVEGLWNGLFQVVSRHPAVRLAHPRCHPRTARSRAGDLRPDLVVRLPNNRVIAVDSKAPFDAYLEATAKLDQEPAYMNSYDYRRYAVGQLVEQKKLIEDLGLGPKQE